MSRRVIEHKYTFVEPGRDRRKRHERMKQLLKIEAGSERAIALASLAREFHDHREINLALDAAARALADIGGSVQVLIGAYLQRERPDLLIEDLAMLSNLGRWMQNDALSTAARSKAYEQALAWCRMTDGRERERRLDTLRRRFDDALADEIDLALL